MVQVSSLPFSKLGSSKRLRRGTTLTSAVTFTTGAALPLLAAWFSAGTATLWAVAIVSLLVLLVLGALGAQTGGAPLWKGALRVAFWGVLAMVATYIVGALFGTVAG